MDKSMRRFGTDGKKRFSIKYPDGRIERYGTCDPKEDERFDILKGEVLGVERHFLTQYQQTDTNYTEPIKQRFLLSDGVLIANGYYDNEHDTFISPEEWLKQT